MVWWLISERENQFKGRLIGGINRLDDKSASWIIKTKHDCLLRLQLTGNGKDDVTNQ